MQKSRIQGGGWGGNNKTAQYKPKTTTPPSGDDPQHNPNTPNTKPSEKPKEPTRQQPKTQSKGTTKRKDEEWLLALPQSPYAHFVVRKDSPHDVYIGRPSKWGNPFKIGPDGTREDVIREYKAWLTSTPQGLAVLAEAKVELKGKVLACFCSPLPCHGHVLAELVNEGEEATVSGKTPKDDLSKYAVPQDGLVLIRSAFTLEEQQIIADEISSYGRGDVPAAGSFFSGGALTMKDGYVDPVAEDSDPQSGYLNIQGSKARMNVPFEICSKKVWELCKPILDNASIVCPSIPPLLHPTCWRLNYYSKKGRIGWHFDRHPFVSADQQYTVKEPVISVTIGNSGIFEYRDFNNVVQSLRLDSGDVVIFGGPSRLVVHQVPRILPNTKPAQLNLGYYKVRGKPDQSFNEGRFNFGFYDNRNEQ